MVDRDRSGFIDERELQQALSSGFHHFNLRTIRLLMFLFKNPHQPLAVGKLTSVQIYLLFFVFLSWGFHCVEINWLSLVPFRRTKGICSTLELSWSMASESLFHFFLYSFLSQDDQGSCYAML